MIAGFCRGSCWVAFCVLVCLAAPPRSVAAEPAAAAKAPEKKDAEARPDESKPLREQSIYIPYDKLRQVFEKQGRGVFLPYEEFERLWQGARDRAQPAAEQKPPVGALITDIDNEAMVEKDVVRVKATVKLEVLAEGWSEIPLRLADAAITSATIDGQPARILGGGGQDHRLLVEKEGKQAQTVELRLEYAKAITRMPGQNSVSFQSPQSPVSRWKVTIPQAGVTVNLHPLLAATEAPAEKKADGKNDEKKDQTVVLAFVGAAPMVRIDWTPKSEGATGLAALVNVQAQQQAWINEGVVRSRVLLTYTISRAELPQLVIEVPADQKVVNVFDDNVRQWSVAEVEGKQRITAQLFEPAKATQRVNVELERFIKDEARTGVALPVVKAVGVGRQQGMVVVNVAAGLQAEATKTSGLMQVDRGELPAELQSGTWAFAYRYAAVPYELALDVEKVQPRSLADSLIEAYLEPERLTIDATVAYTIERSGVFRLELSIPEGYQVRQVRGRELPAGPTAQQLPSPAGGRGAGSEGFAAVQVDNHHLEGEKKTRLVINLSKKAIGRVGLAIELFKELAERDVLTQPGKKAEITVELPKVAGDVERSRGRVMIYAPESLQFNSTDTAGLGDLPSFDKAFEGIPPARDRRPGEGRPAFAWSFADEPTKLKLSAERRLPHVSVKQLLTVRIESGVVHYEATLNYDVRYSGVKSLRLDIPEDLATEIRRETPGVHETTLSPQPGDVAKGDVAWSLSGEAEFLGTGAIRLVWQKNLGKLDVGKSTAIDIPQLRPRKVDRAWGHIVLIKAEALDVATPAEPKGLRPIDPQTDLQPPVTGAARAFEFHDDWKLPVTVTQYQLEDIKRTSIERGLVQMVVTPSGEIAVQALYRMRSAQQRLEVSLDEAEFAAAPLKINGRAVSLERGSPGQFFVPLVESNRDDAFVLELRYSLPQGGQRLRLPAFPQEPAVLKVYLGIYLPAEQTLLGTLGPWTEDFPWQWDNTHGWKPLPRTLGGKTVVDLALWVQEGLTTTASADAFQTDGTLYFFSTLAPAPSPEGDLRVFSLQRDALRAIVFAVALLAGVLLLPVRLGGRVVVVGSLVVLIILGGVFWPTFSRQVLGGAFFAAVAIVLVLWIVWYFARTRPRLVVASAAAPPSPPQPASAAPTKPLGGVATGIDLSKQPAPPSPEANQGGQTHE